MKISTVFHVSVVLLAVVLAGARKAHGAPPVPRLAGAAQVTKVALDNCRRIAGSSLSWLKEKKGWSEDKARRHTEPNVCKEAALAFDYDFGVVCTDEREKRETICSYLPDTGFRKTCWVCMDIPAPRR